MGAKARLVAKTTRPGITRIKWVISQPWRLIRFIWAWGRALTRPPTYQTDRSYRAAIDWLQKFKPSGEVQGYDKALEYAWRKFDQVCAASEMLDKKADNLMRNAGLVAGLLGLSLNTLKVDTPKLLIPSLMAFIISLIFAAIACAPAGGATTATVCDLLDDIGNGRAKDSWIAASVHCAIVGRGSLNNWKASKIRWSTRAFCLGLFLFALPMLALFPTLRAQIPGCLL